jgi:hypothetical protein
VTLFEWQFVHAIDMERFYRIAAILIISPFASVWD